MVAASPDTFPTGFTGTYHGCLGSTFQPFCLDLSSVAGELVRPCSQTNGVWECSYSVTALSGMMTGSVPPAYNCSVGIGPHNVKFLIDLFGNGTAELRSVQR